MPFSAAGGRGGERGRGRRKTPLGAERAVPYNPRSAAAAEVRRARPVAPPGAGRRRAARSGAAAGRAGATAAAVVALPPSTPPTPPPHCAPAFAARSAAERRDLGEAAGAGGGRAGGRVGACVRVRACAGTGTAISCCSLPGVGGKARQPGRLLRGWERGERPVFVIGAGFWKGLTGIWRWRATQLAEGSGGRASEEWGRYCLLLHSGGFYFFFSDHFRSRQQVELCLHSLLGI